MEEEYHQCIERLNSDREKMMKKKIENMKCQESNPLKKVTEEVTDWMTAIKNTQEVTKKHIICETSME